MLRNQYELGCYLHYRHVQRELREEEDAHVLDPRVLLSHHLVEHKGADGGDGKGEGEGGKRGRVRDVAPVLKKALDQEAHVHAVAAKPAASQ
eukprot:1195571-Prorocentrum_minimum.AAC.1